MFKRLSKSRRHSADDVALSLSGSTVPLDQLSGTSMPRDNNQDLNTTSLLKISRSKYTRRSCGDADAMQTLLEVKQDSQQDVIEADYQTVTAVPAFIVEHDPGKQRVSGLGIWGRRMGRKIDSFRRTRSRETICSITEKSASTDHNSVNNNNSNNINNNNACTSNNNINVHQLSQMHLDEKMNRKSPLVCNRSPSPFKSFFIRMGSTGMLNSTKANRRSQNIEERANLPDKESLFRSCSTSQLNSSPTYVKGDDPSEGIDLQIAARKDKTVSCDDLAVHRNDKQSVFEASCASAYSLGGPSVSFSTCDLGQTKDESFMRKSSSCDLKEAKKSSFPYAFLRSKLSVLPEERHGSSFTKDERLFKTVSEEHFPTLQIEDSYIGTTTLGRKRSRIGYVGRGDNGKNREITSRPSRTSCAEFQRNSSRYEADRYSLNASRLERIEAGFQQEGIATCYSLFDSSLLSLRENVEFHVEDTARDKADFTGKIVLGIASENCNVDLDVMSAIRNNRRNSVSSCEQRLSSHYVSSNESGYDSDGPRGEPVIASENERLSFKCSSDTSSVMDSELEKPIRSSTPSEGDQDQDEKQAGKNRRNCDENRSDAISRMSIERLDGLRWHRSGSGRLLPSIHGTSFEEEAVLRLEDAQLPNCEDRLSLLSNTAKALDVSPHRMRLQQDKTRFLSDIIQPLTRVRRCCLIQLHKRDPKESLGIRLAQQRLGDLRYIVVQLESDGIAHRDGRLRLGDEIVEVEGKELRTLESLEEVQEFLRSSTGNTIRLTTAYEETVPQVYENPSPSTLPGEYEYLENAKNLSDMSLIDPETNYASSSVTETTKKKKKKTTDTGAESFQPRKRPDFLPLSARLSENQKDIKDSGPEPVTESQQYLMKHMAKFEKGYGKPSLGFSVVGGRDSPRGDMGIFVRRVFPGGQADTSKSLFQGDEILTLNGQILKGRTHQEVIELFKMVREGTVELEITRRHRYPRNTLKSAPY
ncbi:uncharacterized protein LOC115243160 isoform X1 [Formica exsecta]|uniref:uncharacterized protein LOC115243160 isoform X1 n=1 Tax=Formica exsecta TaxID=72781 RepID=UPI0011436570|nr:uncharacterized protein LOC115243160 isoform X1 [Formica exsecta]XP_029675773.1 uncharacterized protein LOC115243160 isoform X1 [Formica exsecta]XP_029675774.1 uncharacterized protein LOC115243160 isoform X1 [Formica exsecta]